MFQIIDAIFSNNTNIFAFITLVILTALALLGTYSTRFKALAKYARQSPAILATVGIFFSFWGISIGLIEFDAKDSAHIIASTPKLLDGLKVKFIASLMGIGFSIIVRIAQSFKSEATGIDNEQIMIDLLIDIKQSLSSNNPELSLKELNHSIAALPVEFKKQSSLLEAIKISLAGDSDTSVTTQLSKVRIELKDGLSELDEHNKQYFDELNTHNKQYLGAINKNIKDGFDGQNSVLNNSFNDLTNKFDELNANNNKNIGVINKNIKDGFDGQNSVLNDSFNNLTNKFDEFARVLAENNSKTFIEALEKAMRDFNNNITEQFGDNFKQLNEAVGQLLIWQENYKTHVEKLTDNFEVALISIGTINTAFGEIKNRSESFTGTSEKLHGILESLDRQLQDLSNYLQAFNELADNAKNSFPIIKTNLNDLTNGFKKSTQESLNSISETVKDASNQLKDASGQLTDTTSAMRHVMEQQKDAFDYSNQEFKTVVDDTLKNLSTESQKSIDRYRDALQYTVAEQLRAIETNVKQSNELINKTIQDASTTFKQTINSTGKHLTEATNDVSHQLTTATSSMKSMIDTQTKTLGMTSKDFKATIDKTLHDLAEQSKTTIQQHENELQKAVQEQMNHISSAIQSSSEQFNKLLIENTMRSTSVLEQQTIQLDKALQNELTKSIEKMGSILTTLSMQFVNDYTPLTERLREVVRMAGRN